MEKQAFKHISIIIPFYNEEQNIAPVLNEIIDKVPGAEIIAIDDGSTDNTLEELNAFVHINKHSLPYNQGKGVAVWHGLQLASNEYCVIIDGDGQFDPFDIPKIASLLSDADLVSGFRQNRMDNQSTIIVSRFSNSIRRMMLGDSIRDTGSIKGLRRTEALKHLFPFEGMHRYMPSIFAAAGLTCIEIPVGHRPRLYGKSKYSHTRRAIRGIIDLVRMKIILSVKY